MPSVTVTVKNVVDGDTFSIQGSVKYKKKSYSVIRPTGYDTPEKGEEGYDSAKMKLRKLIVGKKVQLSNPVGYHGNRLVCEVHYDGINLADYFPEYN